MSRKTKLWLIIATILVVIGCVIFASVMTVLKWDFSELSTDKFESNTYEITDSFSNVSIISDTADIIFKVSDNETCGLVCYEKENEKYSVFVQNDTLFVKINPETKWYKLIGINFYSPKITIFLPESDYNSISVKGSTGDIDIQNISANVLDVSVSTGDVRFKNINCQNLTSKANTGDIYLENVVATKELLIERTTGDVEFEKCDANEIFVKTSTGDVEGSLLTNKIFVVETSTGDIEVPKTSNGGKCEIKTSTGDVEITVK